MDLMKEDKKLTHVCFVLDRSGSMSSIRDNIIDAFNEQLEQFRNPVEGSGEYRISVVTFGGSYFGSLGTFEQHREPVEVVLNGVDPKKVLQLNQANYVTAGWTPMYDGVGTALNMLERHDDEGDDTAFLVVVLSDGMENHSQEWTADQIAQKVSNLEETGRWTFAYVGADQNLANKAQHIGITDTGTFGTTVTGVDTLSNQMRGATVSYMSMRATGQTHSDYATNIDKNDSNET